MNEDEGEAPILKIVVIGIESITKVKAASANLTSFRGMPTISFTSAQMRLLGWNLFLSK